MNTSTIIQISVFFVALILMHTTTQWKTLVTKYAYVLHDWIFIATLVCIVLVVTVIDLKLGTALSIIIIFAILEIKYNPANFTDYTNNISPPSIEQFQNPQPPPSTEPDNTQTASSIIDNKMEKQSVVNTTCQPQEFNTFNAGKDYHGYDVAGCRYDLVSSTQNLTIYGSPLSWCDTYDNNKHSTHFYPLNA